MPVWERGVRVKFHYTQPDFAELILAEQTYRVSARERSSRSRAVCDLSAAGIDA